MTDSSKDMVARLCTLHQLKFSKVALPICKATSCTSAGKDQASIDARICHDMSIKSCLPNKSFLSGHRKPKTAKLTLRARRITLMCNMFGDCLAWLTPRNMEESHSLNPVAVELRYCQLADDKPIAMLKTGRSLRLIRCSAHNLSHRAGSEPL